MPLPNPHLPLAVLMGGNSAEHNVSLQSGKAMYQALCDTGFHNIRPIVVSKKHEWMLNEKPVTIADALKDVDAALLAFHGTWGEDGRAQALLEWFRIPYNGSAPTASALAMDKSLSRMLFRAQNLSVPKSTLHTKPMEPWHIFLHRVLQNYSYPFIVKPVSSGSSLGVTLVSDAQSAIQAFHKALRYDDRFLIEEYVEGEEVSCAILEDVHGNLQALPIARIVPPPHHTLFDFDAKYSGETQEVIPAPLPDTLAYRVKEAALRAHRVLGCRHYSRVDIILQKNIPVVLEVNTLPGLTPHSLLPKMASAAGFSYSQLIERLLELALSDA